MSTTLTPSEATMADAPAPFRPLPLSRIPSVRRRILRELPAAFVNPDCVEIVMNDGSRAIRNAGERRCMVIWADGSGAAPERLDW